MKMTDFTRRALHYRRGVRDLLAAGYEEIGESGGQLWELHRGWRLHHVITDVKIGPDGKALFVKTAPEQSSDRRRIWEQATNNAIQPQAQTWRIAD